MDTAADLAALQSGVAIQGFAAVVLYKGFGEDCIVVEFGDEVLDAL